MLRYHVLAYITTFHVMLRDAMCCHAMSGRIISCSACGRNGKGRAEQRKAAETNRTVITTILLLLLLIINNNNSSSNNSNPEALAILGMAADLPEGGVARGLLIAIITTTNIIAIITTINVIVIITTINRIAIITTIVARGLGKELLVMITVVIAIIIHIIVILIHIIIMIIHITIIVVVIIVIQRGARGLLRGASAKSF